MIQIFSFIIGVAVAVSGALFVKNTFDGDGIKQDTLTLGSSMTGSVWFLNASQQIQAAKSTWGLRVPSLGSPANPCLSVGTTGIFATTTCGSGSGSDAISTSTALADTQVVYATGAGTIGSEAAFTYDDATNKLTVANASTTLVTATNFYGALVGNANTATSLFANGSNCSAGNSPLGVDASGAVESCFDVWTEAENTAAAYLSSVDISDDTNLAGDTEIVLTGDALSIASTIARDTELHSAVTLAGEDYLSLATQQITANAIDADNLSATDFGSFTCNGTTCTLDASSITESMFNVNTATNDYVLTASSTAAGGFAWAASSGSGGSLNSAYDFGGAGVGRSITADTGAVEITVPDASNNAALTINQNDVTNNPNGLRVVNAGSASSIYVESTSAGASGAIIELFHNSASPSATDQTGFEFYAKNGSAETKQMGSIFAVWDVLTAGSEDSAIEIWASADGFLETGGIRVTTDANAHGHLSSIGNQDLTLQTGNTTTGNITLTDGANGAITLAPNGTGQVVVQGGNLLIEDNAMEFNAIPFTLMNNIGVEFLTLAGSNSGVNEITISNAITAESPVIETSGGDTNIDLTLTAKGSGDILITDNVGIGTTTAGAELDVWGDSGATILTLFSNAGTKFMEMLNTGVTTLLGVWDFGGATSLETVNGSAPTVDATGEFAVDTTSDQWIYYGTSTKRVLSFYEERSLYLASTTKDKSSNTFISGTTTHEIANFFQPVTLNRFYCKTDAGTVKVRFGDGTNWTALGTCTTSGVEVSGLSNNTFTTREDIQVQTGTDASSPNKVTITATFLTTAD